MAQNFKSDNVIHIFSTKENVAAHNYKKLIECSQPVARIDAIHQGVQAKAAPSDLAGGLEPVIYLSSNARVMLTSNLWLEKGLVNGAMGKVVEVCYKEGSSPPALPLSVNVRFDDYSGPTLANGTVPITPITRSWFTANGESSRQQLPLRLAYGMSIHKSQGLTLKNVVIDLGSKEFSTGLSFVACSRAKKLSDIMFSNSLTLTRLESIKASKTMKARKNEVKRLEALRDSKQIPSRSLKKKHFSFKSKTNT